MKKALTDYRDFYRRQLLEDVMPFWMNSDLLDREYGGCITSVDRTGRSYNEDKSVWFQGRCFPRAFLLSEWQSMRPRLEMRTLCIRRKTVLNSCCRSTAGRRPIPIKSRPRPTHVPPFPQGPSIPCGLEKHPTIGIHTVSIWGTAGMAGGRRTGQTFS